MGLHLVNEHAILELVKKAKYVQAQTTSEKANYYDSDERPNVQLGLRLKKLRKDAGLTAEDLSYHAGISTRQLFNLENGTSAPRRDTLVRLANALKIHVAQLCPSYSLATLTELMQGRFVEELTAVRSFFDQVRSEDLETLSLVLDAYKDRRINYWLRTGDLCSVAVLGKVSGSEDLIFNVQEAKDGFCISATV